MSCHQYVWVFVAVAVEACGHRELTCARAVPSGFLRDGRVVDPVGHKLNQPKEHDHTDDREEDQTAAMPIARPRGCLWNGSIRGTVGFRARLVGRIVIQARQYRGQQKIGSNDPLSGPARPCSDA
jgi:hypothetical protein